GGGAGRGSEFAFYFLPQSPAERTREFREGGRPALAIEYLRETPEERWRDLSEPLPEGAEHGLIVEMAGEEEHRPDPKIGQAGGNRRVFAIVPGSKLNLGNGYTLEVRELGHSSEFPIVTAGYRGAESGYAVVRVTPPDGRAFDRFVYHRFPEIAQDLSVSETNERGMPVRSAADTAIRLSYIDGSIPMQVVMDERADGTVRGLVRIPRQPLRPFAAAGPGAVAQDIAGQTADQPRFDLVFGPRWEHAERIERPRVVPEQAREKAEVGTHGHAMLAVEVAAGPGTPAGFRRTVWLPFTRYLGAGMGTERTVALPDGRSVTLAFGRVMHGFPEFLIQLVDFQMIAYDHRGSPRDYQSIVRVIPTHDGSGPPGFRQYEHITKLNAPLQAPFIWSEERGYLGNVFGQLGSRLSPRQFKLSQAGWDSDGWRRTQQMADAGQLPRPYASFTILGVGNNPGIHIIAAGAVLVSLGIPWAFYIKPLIVRRQAARLRAQVEAGEIPVPARGADAMIGLNGSIAGAGRPTVIPAGVDE
ncbi:MAG: hypothetical protein WD749_13265, partial [Phycisphaerales bacterium]